MLAQSFAILLVVAAAALTWSGCCDACGVHQDNGHGEGASHVNENPFSSLGDLFAVGIKNKPDSVTSGNRVLLEAFSSLQNRLHQLEVHLQTLAETPQPGGGSSVYVRWGNAECPQSAELVYTGVMSGSHYSTSGGAANILCLPLTPTFTSDIPHPVYGIAKLYGVEYEVKPHPANDLEGLCSICSTAQASTLMIPATNVCPEGWTCQYSGYLMAGKPDGGRVSTEYICVDKTMEGGQGTGQDYNEGVVYFTQYACGSLPCPPFRQGKIATCVVCSK